MNAISETNTDRNISFRSSTQLTLGSAKGSAEFKVNPNKNRGFQNWDMDSTITSDVPNGKYNDSIKSNTYQNSYDDGKISNDVDGLYESNYHDDEDGSEVLLAGSDYWKLDSSLNESIRIGSLSRDNTTSLGGPNRSQMEFNTDTRASYSSQSSSMNNSAFNHGNMNLILTTTNQDYQSQQNHKQLTGNELDEFEKLEKQLEGIGKNTNTAYSVYAASSGISSSTQELTNNKPLENSNSRSINNNTSFFGGGNHVKVTNEDNRNLRQSYLHDKDINNDDTNFEEDSYDGDNTGTRRITEFPTDTSSSFQTGGDTNYNIRMSMNKSNSNQHVMNDNFGSSMTRTSSTWGASTRPVMNSSSSTSPYPTTSRNNSNDNNDVISNHDLNNSDVDNDYEDLMTKTSSRMTNGTQKSSDYDSYDHGDDNFGRGGELHRSSHGKTDTSIVHSRPVIPRPNTDDTSRRSTGTLLECYT